MTKPVSDAPEPLLVCPICGQKLRRMNSSHVRKHGLTIEEFIAKYGCMKILRPRKVDPKAQIECPICHQKLRRMNSSHLGKHDLSIGEFNAKYRQMKIPKPIDPKARIECPLCDHRLRRMNSSHLKKHGLTMEQFAALYGKPERDDPLARVVCPICKRKLRRINSSHLRKHGITPEDFKRRYGAYWYPQDGFEGTNTPGPYGHIHKAHARASQMVQYAVRIGMIQKPNRCPKCGRGDTRIHGHHEDYNKPLEVVWLCQFCHRKLHSLIGKTG